MVARRSDPRDFRRCTDGLGEPAEEVNKRDQEFVTAGAPTVGTKLPWWDRRGG